MVEGATRAAGLALAVVMRGLVLGYSVGDTAPGTSVDNNNLDISKSWLCADLKRQRCSPRSSGFEACEEVLGSTQSTCK